MRGHLVLVITHPKKTKIKNSIGERPFFILNIKVFLTRKSQKPFIFYQFKITTKNVLSPRGFLIQKHSRWEAYLIYFFNVIKSEWFWAFSINSEWFWDLTGEKNFKNQNTKWPLTCGVFEFGIFPGRDYKYKMTSHLCGFLFFLFFRE